MVFFAMRIVGATFCARCFRFTRVSAALCISILLLTSCASVSTPQRTDSETIGNLRWADYTGKVKKMWDLNFLVSAIDGKDIWDYWDNGFQREHGIYGPELKKYRFRIPQGLHTIDVTATWSNRCKDTTPLPLDVKEGVRYVVYTYELKEGADPSAPIPFHEGPPGDHEGPLVDRGPSPSMTMDDVWRFLLEVPPALGGQAGALMIMTAPVWVPIAYLFVRHNREETSKKIVAYAEYDPTTAPTTRPFDGCCFVWVEDADTRDVVAGTRPPGAGR